MAEGIACYSPLIGGMLDMTDNLFEGQVVLSSEVHRRDGDDPLSGSGGQGNGDVFGNGLLLSEQIRLLAAFDHRHIGSCAGREF